jgi:hypothetical protein
MGEGFDGEQVRLRRLLFSFLRLLQAIHDQFLQATDALFFLNDVTLLL